MKIKSIFTFLLLLIFVPGMVFGEDIGQGSIIQSPINKKNVAGIEKLEVNDLFSGAGTYSIPFSFPKGPKAIKPGFSLGYNSYSTDAFTPYGYAWNLSIPKISRNPKKGIANIYQNNDFVASGEELIIDQSDETLYTSKYLNNLNKYYFENNIWRVIDSKGNTYYYGSTNDSRLSDDNPFPTSPSNQGEGQMVKTYSWNLVKKVDNRGNEIVYNYFKDNNQVYLDTITYAGGLYKIEFNYADKATSLSSYRTQFEVKTSKLLSSIVFKTNNIETKRYEFSYDNVNTVFSHLISVEETSPQPSPQGEGEKIYRKYNFQYGAGKDMHLLKQITDNKGLQVDFEYKPSVFYKDDEGNNLNPTLPFNLKTLHKITYLDTTTGVNNVETFEYAGGAFYFDATDLYGREYAGFHKVTKVVTPSVLTDSSPSNQGEQKRKEIYYFHQGENSIDDPEFGEYEDHISKKGKVFRKEIYTSPPTPLLAGEVSQGKWQLFRSEITKWNTEFSDDQWRVLKQREARNLISSKSTTSSAIEYVYDEYSNITEKIEYGEVILINQKGDFTDIKQDKKTTQFSYAKNEALNLYGFTKSQELYDFYNTLASKKEILYDNLNAGNVNFGDITSIKTYDTPTTFSEEKRQYNTKGLLAKTINPRGYETTYTYDAYGIYPLSITNAKGFSESFEYDYTTGKPSKKISINGLEILLEYDSIGRLTSQKVKTDSEHTTKQMSYDDVSIPNSIQTTLYFDTIGADTQDIIVYKDGFGNTIQTKKSYKEQYVTTKFEYDSRGNRLYTTYPTFEPNSSYSVLNKTTEFGDSYEYDVLNRVKKISNTSGDIEYTYSNLDFTITNQAGIDTSYEYNIFGNLIKVVEPGNIETEYSYNALGQLTKVTDADNNERNIVYDISGKRLEIEDLHGVSDTVFGTRKYEYDENGNIAKYTTLSGDDIFYSYDELDRVILESLGTQSTGYTYDIGENAKGLLSSYSKGNYSENYNYDIYGNIISETKTYGTDNYVYNYTYGLVGQKLSDTYPDGKTTSYNYENGILKGVNYDGLELVQSVGYNPALKITDLSYANNAVTKNIYDYEEGYKLTNKGLLSGDEQYGLTSYTFDNLGNITRLKEEGTIEGFEKDIAYSYDDLNRLTSADYLGGGIITYDYSALGNVLNNSRVGNYEYTDNGTNNPHAVTALTPALSLEGEGGEQERIIYVYDANGNVISDEKGSYTYNPKDELIESETNSGVVTSYEYNLEGIRVEKRSDSKTNRYLNKDYEVEVESTASGEVIKTSKYIFFGNKKLATIETVYNPPLTPPSNEGGGHNQKIIYHHEDHLGGGNIDLSSTGGFLQVVDYYPFGSVREKQNTGEYENKYLFSGKEEDSETDLQYFEARYYDNNIGRFRSIDRVFWEVGGFDNKKKDERGDIVLMFPQKQNAYSYVENNPLNKTDITGEFSDTIADSNPIALYVKAVVTVGVVLGKFVSDEVVDRVIDRGEGVVSVTGSPGSGGKKPKKENREKDIKSLEKQISIHKKKLENYIKNPDKYDNKGFLQKAGANTDLRNKIINSRIKHLKKEIQNFKNNIKKLKTN